MSVALNSRALSAALASHRYADLEKAIQREADPAEKKALERDLMRMMRLGVK